MTFSSPSNTECLAFCSTEPTDAQLREIQALIDLSESTELDESELDADSYADAIMSELGL